MPCGRTSRGQFASQAEYEAHRIQMMKLILGDDWEDQPLSQLVEAHPELHELSLHELIARHEDDHEHTHDEPEPLGDNSITPTDSEESSPQQPWADAPQAIEGWSGRQTAEDWIRDYLREHDGSERED